jgi:hypothetical protein
MAYNNAFPATYQPMGYIPQFQQPQQQIPQQQMPQAQPQPQQIQQNNPMIWVQGETGAKSYLLAPNTTLPLWDSENQCIYLKSTDASGMPSMRILDYTFRETAQPHVPVQNNSRHNTDFVTHEELKDFEKKIAHKIDDLFGKEAEHEPDSDATDVVADKK